MDLAWDIRFRLRRDHSQFGEQEILLAELPEQGSYLEIGAHQPIKCSNTYALYRRGWRGWCVDPQVEFAWLWRAFRPKDRFIGKAVVSGDNPNEGTTVFYNFEDRVSLVSSTDYEHAQEWEKKGFRYRKQEVPTVSIGFLYSEFCRVMGGPPTILLLDVEGADMALLNSLDLSPTRPDRPKYILFEADPSEVETAVPHGYVVVAQRSISTLCKVAT